MAPLATIQIFVCRRLDTPNFDTPNFARAMFEMNDRNDCASVNRIGMPYTKTLRGNLNRCLADGQVYSLTDVCGQRRDVYPYRSRDLRSYWDADGDG